jgi:hypothetical protein
MGSAVLVDIDIDIDRGWMEGRGRIAGSSCRDAV